MMAEQGAKQEAAIRNELARIVSSEPFERSARMRDFLTYVVEETLQGRGNRIKAFSIARDVFDKDESFDSQHDTIVRVEAGRLRRRLAAWYSGPGRESSIQIEIPVGGYVPLFNQVGPERGLRNRFGIPALLALLMLVLLVVAWFWFPTGGEPDKSKSHVESSIPFVAILPLKLSGGTREELRIAEGFTESLITSLAKLSGVSVMAHASIMGFDAEEVDISFLRDRYGVSHILRGNLASSEDSITMNLQLVSTHSSSVVWANTLNARRADIWRLQESLSKQVTESLSIDIMPAEKEIYLRRHSDNLEALAYYRQGWLLLIPPNNIDRILTARQLFNRAVELDPEFAGGYAGAGFSHAITVLFINADRPQYELQRAAELAQKAIKVDPGFGMGYATLSFARALEQRLAEGLENARLAIELSPGDAFVQFIYGMNLVLAGHPEEATQALERAIRLDPTEVRTPYMNVLAIAHYASGDYAGCIELLDRNKQRGGPTGPHMDTFRAAALLGLGQDQQAAALISDVQEKHPSFRAESWLRKWLAQSEQFETTLLRMREVGLSTSEPGWSGRQLEVSHSK